MKGAGARIFRSAGQSTIAACAAIALLIAAGWAIGAEHAVFVLLLLAAVGLGVVALTQRGLLIGLLLLAIMNGIPGFDTYVEIGGIFTYQDLAVCALFAVAAGWAILDAPVYRPTRIGRVLTYLAAALLCWWLWIVTWTVVSQHVPAANAIGYGRDFLYFALLLLALPRVRLTTSDTAFLLGALAVGACVFAVGQIGTTVGIGGFESLINVRYTTQDAGFTRVYAFMTDLVVFMLAMCMSAYLLAPQQSVRRIALPVGLLMLLSTALTLTRAYWIGMSLSVVLVTLWFLRDNRKLRSRLVWVFGAFGVVAVAGGAILVVVAPGSLFDGAFLQRVLSTATDLQGGGGSVGVREAATETTAVYLGENWFQGLGFVPPSSHYYYGLIEGSIRDSDLGFLGAVVTMGVVGAALLYAPVVVVLQRSLQRSPWSATQHEWIIYGGAVWMVATLISSLTLVTLFTVSGLVLTAVVLTVLAQPQLTGAAEQTGRERDYLPHGTIEIPRSM